MKCIPSDSSEGLPTIGSSFPRNNSFESDASTIASSNWSFYSQGSCIPEDEEDEDCNCIESSNYKQLEGWVYLEKKNQTKKRFNRRFKRIANSLSPVMDTEHEDECEVSWLKLYATLHNEFFHLYKTSPAHSPQQSPMIEIAVSNVKPIDNTGFLIEDPNKEVMRIHLYDQTSFFEWNSRLQEAASLTQWFFEVNNTSSEALPRNSIYRGSLSTYLKSQESTWKLLTSGAQNKLQSINQSFSRRTFSFPSSIRNRSHSNSSEKIGTKEKMINGMVRKMKMKKSFSFNGQGNSHALAMLN